MNAFYFTLFLSSIILSTLLLLCSSSGVLKLRAAACQRNLSECLTGELWGLQGCNQPQILRFLFSS